MVRNRHFHPLTKWLFRVPGLSIHPPLSTRVDSTKQHAVNEKKRRNLRRKTCVAIIPDVFSFHTNGDA